MSDSGYRRPMVKWLFLDRMSLNMDGDAEAHWAAGHARNMQVMTTSSVVVNSVSSDLFILDDWRESRLVHCVLYTVVFRRRHSFGPLPCPKSTNSDEQEHSTVLWRSTQYAVTMSEICKAHLRRGRD